MEITCPTHPTPSSPPVSPSGSPMTSSSPETAPPTPPCIATSVPSRLSWHGPNLLLSLPHVKFYVFFYFSLHQRPRPPFIACLKHLCRQLRGSTIWLYVDRARWHKGEEVGHLFVRTHRRLRLRFLPPYQPQLNPQERIWRQVRYEATTNCWFESLDHVWDTVQRTTRCWSWSPHKIRRLCQII